MTRPKFTGYSDFKEDNDWLGTKSRQYIKNLPWPLNDLGKESFRRLPWHPCPYTVVLPFWVGDIYQLSRDQCRLVALPGCLGSFYVFLQDRIMDESENQWTAFSPLGTVLFTEMMKQYRALFSADSPFWNYLEQYITEWLQSVSWEEASHWDKLQDYSEDDLLLIARKAAMFKLSAMPVALLAKHEETVRPLAEYVDYSQVVFDLIDQLRDWRQDLRDRHYGYLLTKAILTAGWSHSSPPSEGFVRRAFLITDVLDSVISLAVKYSRLAENCVSHLKGRYLTDYACSLSRHCEQMISQIAIDREQAFKNIFEA